MCYDELINKNIDTIGESLYLEHFYFANTYELIDVKYQQRIKEYNFCKTFSIPPYASLNTTPANVIDEFLQIDKEMNSISKNKGKNK